MSSSKLFMILLGCKPPGRHTEQHDFFFGIGTSLRELVPEIKAFWPEAADHIHVDGWREVTVVDNFKIEIQLRSEVSLTPVSGPKLFFINLGGYQENKFEEQHYTILTVKKDKAAAFREAKETLFYKTNYFPGTSSHIDDRYGIDVDDLYQIEDLLSKDQKNRYRIVLHPIAEVSPDKLNLGYFKLSSL